MENGAYGGGTIFRMNGSYHVIYNFCAQPDCSDGVAAEGMMIMDSAGSLFGTAAAGGGAENGGTVFEFTP